MVQVFLRRLAANPAADPAPVPMPFEPGGLEVARRTIRAWPGYAATPLRNLSDLATELDLGAIHYKDEGPRFGLGSFKPLGGAYAVARRLAKVIAEQTGDRAPDLLLPSSACADIARGITVTAATDGNHGRSVAWGARMFGCRCVIFVCASVSQGRIDAIASFGAEIRKVEGGFDDAVRMADETARAENWHVIPDTSDGKTIEAPRDVTQGYMLMADEALSQLPPGSRPTHVFLQAGVGGMASASCARLWQAFATARPVITLVEPDHWACWYESLSAGRPVPVAGETDSIMAGLSCGEVSLIAWEILLHGADFMLTLDDDAAPTVMRYLAEVGSDDRPVVGGESGVAGLAGLIAAAQAPEARASLGLDRHSRVLVFGSEGATDPVTYEAIVGRTAEEVLHQ